MCRALKKRVCNTKGCRPKFCKEIEHLSRHMDLYEMSPRSRVIRNLTAPTQLNSTSECQDSRIYAHTEQRQSGKAETNLLDTGTCEHKRSEIASLRHSHANVLRVAEELKRFVHPSVSIGIPQIITFARLRALKILQAAGTELDPRVRSLCSGNSVGPVSLKSFVADCTLTGIPDACSESFVRWESKYILLGCGDPSIFTSNSVFALLEKTTA